LSSPRSRRLFSVAAVLGIVLTPVNSIASQSQFYFALNCLSQIEDQDSCNATFLNKSINIRFSNGRTTRVRYDSIKAWKYSDKKSYRLNEEMVIGFGAPGLIIGTLFRRAQHQYTFTIVYDSGFGDEDVVLLNFSDKKYVQPVFDQLRANAGSVELPQKN
jgi:hypothetical protein